MKISMIAAMGKNRVIGHNNDIPWHLPDDFKYFKTTTKNHYVIMGRKNWESLPPNFQPLPDRPNLVISRQQGYTAKGAEVLNSLEKAIETAREAGEVEAFIIGGGEIYRMGLTLCDKIYLTEIKEAFDGQVTFPEFSKKDWEETSRIHHPMDERHKFSFDFVIYESKRHGIT